MREGKDGVMSRTRFVWVRLFAALFLVAAMAVTAGADPGKDEAHGKEGKGKHEKHRSKPKDWESYGYDGYFPEQGYTTLDIPPGHLPPPGKCRLWYPDRPPGHQPPPENCGHLRAHAPVGAWLVHRPKERPTYVDVSVYDAYQPGIVISIGLFDVNTGAFLRHLSPR
jgi:hypothetical protein